VIVLCGILAAGPAWAQAPADPVSAPQAPTAQPDQARLRFQISVVEGALGQAVQHGANQFRRRWQAISPDSIVLGAPSRVRGFVLDGYGVFFVVDVPELRQSLAWSVRNLPRPADASLQTTLKSFKSSIESVSDARARQELEQLLTIIEMQIEPMAQLQGPGVTQAAGQQSRQVDPTVAALVKDPGAAYTEEVKSALIDAMLEHCAAIRLGADEWLTVAARDTESPNPLMVGEPADTMTITLRIRGSDLAAYRSERITREEARRRVEVREF
jgi:hypothetical protein